MCTFELFKQLIVILKILNLIKKTNFFFIKSYIFYKSILLFMCNELIVFVNSVNKTSNHLLRDYFLYIFKIIHLQFFKFMIRNFVLVIAKLDLEFYLKIILD